MGYFQDTTACLNLFNLPVAISAVSQSQVIMSKTPAVAFNYRSDTDSLNKPRSPTRTEQVLGELDELLVEWKWHASSLRILRLAEEENKEKKWGMIVKLWLSR